MEGVHTLIDRYRQAGIRDISYDFYDGGRHEMLNQDLSLAHLELAEMLHTKPCINQVACVSRAGLPVADLGRPLGRSAQTAQ